MTDNEMQRQKDELAQALLSMTEMLEPMLEAAEGQRAKLESRGWSPTAAEAVALQMLQAMLVGALGQIGK